MRIDHNGVVSSIPAKADSIPKWPGWTDKFDHIYQGDIPYRSKMNPDGSELRFSYDMWNTPGEDRFKVSSVSPQGVRREGFVDSTGQIVIPPKYTWVNHFYNGLTAVREKKGEPWLLLDKNGNLKYTLPKNLQPDINNIFRGVSKEGMLAVQEGDIEVMFGVGTDGLYDLSNQKFFPLGRSTVITQFSEGLCLFESGTPSLAGYGDVSGNVVIPRQFDEASSFEDGLASVRLGKQRGLIDHTGHFVVKFSDRFIRIDPFHEGLAKDLMSAITAAAKVGEDAMDEVDRLEALTGKKVQRPVIDITKSESMVQSIVALAKSEKTFDPGFIEKQFGISLYEIPIHGKPNFHTGEFRLRPSNENFSEVTLNTIGTERDFGLSLELDTNNCFITQAQIDKVFGEPETTDDVPPNWASYKMKDRSISCEYYRHGFKLLKQIYFDKQRDKSNACRANN